MRRAALVLAGAGALLAGCGTPGHDLMVVERTGSLPAARLGLRVIDSGFVTCNGGPERELTSALLIEAREVERDLEPLAASGLRLATRPNSNLQYRIRMEGGTVAFADTSGGQPEAFYRAALLVRRIAKEACGLPR
jgi:hypothetical protein